MNHSQQNTFNEITAELEKEIRELGHKIDNIGRLMLYPKKDGSEKKNIPLNFGTVEGESFIRKRSYGEEKIRYVKVELQSYHAKLDFFPIWDKDDPNCTVPIHPSTEHYINYPDGKDANNITAIEIFELAKGKHLEELKQEKAHYEETLANLPSHFEALCKMANELHKFVLSTENIPVIHRYAYQLEGKSHWALHD